MSMTIVRFEVRRWSTYVAEAVVGAVPLSQRSWTVQAFRRPAAVVARTSVVVQRQAALKYHNTR